MFNIDFHEYDPTATFLEPPGDLVDTRGYHVYNCGNGLLIVKVFLQQKPNLSHLYGHLRPRKGII